MNAFFSSNPATGGSIFNKISNLVSTGKIRPAWIRSDFPYFILLLLISGGASGFMWIFFPQQAYSTWLPLLIMAGAAITGCAAFLLSITFPDKAQYGGIIYALSQGIFTGGMNGYIWRYLTPAALPSAALVLFSVLVSYVARKSGLRKETGPRGVLLVTFAGGLVVSYFFSVVLRLAGVFFPMIHETSLAGCILCLVLLALTSLNIYQALDFSDRIETLDTRGVFSAYRSFACLTVVFWIYVDILFLIFSSIRRQDPRIQRRNY